MTKDSGRVELTITATPTPNLPEEILEVIECAITPSAAADEIAHKFRNETMVPVLAMVVDYFLHDSNPAAALWSAAFACGFDCTREISITSKAHDLGLDKSSMTKRIHKFKKHCGLQDFDLRVMNHGTVASMKGRNAKAWQGGRLRPGKESFARLS